MSAQSSMAWRSATSTRWLDTRVPVAEMRAAAEMALGIAVWLVPTGLVEGFVGPGAALSLVRAVAGLGFLVIWGAGLRALAGNG